MTDKREATGVQGIFRLSGSEKRIKELKTIFDSPDRYGKGLVWDGYTVHDAANVFRRYLNDLPEPVVPLELYDKFREPLRGATVLSVGDTEGPQFVQEFDEKAAIRKYQQLITELPPLNRQLLLYLLDLLAVFAAKAEESRMNSQNLAAIFQPGMLSHPSHAMSPEEYRLNQCVIIFLIENQDHFLIGMQGTEADEKTKQEVEAGSGFVTPTANRKSGLGRSASDASAGAESVRREGKVRRNRSVSSRNSRLEGSRTPNSPVLASTPTSGLGRSNTVPSKKSPAVVGEAKFRKHETPSPRSPTPLEPLKQVSPTEVPSRSEQSSLSPVAVGATNATLGRAATAGRSQERLLEVPREVSTPSKERNLQAIFQRSPGDSSERRQPNKLRKRRTPGSLNPSAQSSNASLSLPPSTAASPNAEKINPMEALQPIAATDTDAEQRQVGSEQQPPTPALQTSDVSADVTPRAAYQVPSHGNLHPEQSLKGKKSPPQSLNSSFNEGSDLEHVAQDQQATTEAEQADREKRRKWRLSRSKKEEVFATGSPPRTAAHRSPHLGSNHRAETSNTSIGSSAQQACKGSTNESVDPAMALSGEGQETGKDKDDSKGPIGWIKNKYREAKENAEQRRARSPPADSRATGSGTSPQGQGVDVKRGQSSTEEREGEPAKGKETAKEQNKAKSGEETETETQQGSSQEPAPGRETEKGTNVAGRDEAQPESQSPRGLSPARAEERARDPAAEEQARIGETTHEPPPQASELRRGEDTGVDP